MAAVKPESSHFEVVTVEEALRAAMKAAFHKVQECKTEPYATKVSPKPGDTPDIPVDARNHLR